MARHFQPSTRASSPPKPVAAPLYDFVRSLRNRPIISPPANLVTPLRLKTELDAGELAKLFQVACLSGMPEKPMIESELFWKLGDASGPELAMLWQLIAKHGASEKFLVHLTKWSEFSVADFTPRHYANILLNALKINSKHFEESIAHYLLTSASFRSGLKKSIPGFSVADLGPLSFVLGRIQSKDDDLLLAVASRWLASVGEPLLGNPSAVAAGIYFINRCEFGSLELLSSLWSQLSLNDLPNHQLPLLLADVSSENLERVRRQIMKAGISGKDAIQAVRHFVGVSSRGPSESGNLSLFGDFAFDELQRELSIVIRSPKSSRRDSFLWESRGLAKAMNKTDLVAEIDKALGRSDSIRNRTAPSR